MDIEVKASRSINHSAFRQLVKILDSGDRQDVPSLWSLKLGLTSASSASLKERKFQLELDLGKQRGAKYKALLTGRENIQDFLKTGRESANTAFSQLRQVDYVEDMFDFRVFVNETSTLNSSYASRLIHDANRELSFSFKKTFSVVLNKTVCIEVSEVRKGFGLKQNIFNIPPKYELLLQVRATLSTTSIVSWTWKLIPEIKLLGLFQILVGSAPFAIDVAEKQEVLLRYNQLIGKPMSKPSWNSYRNVLFLGPSVVSFTHDHLKGGANDLFTPEFTVTAKTDGERYLGIVLNRKMYLISRTGEVLALGVEFKTDSANHSLFDGECVRRSRESRKSIFHFIIFDMYFHQREDLRVLDLRERLKRIEIPEFSLCEGNVFDHIEIKKKHFAFADAQTPLCECIRSFLEENLEYETDGLIFTRNVPLIGTSDYCLVASSIHSSAPSSDINTPYFTPNFINTGKTWPSLVKWKPRNLLTVDFQIKLQKNEPLLMTLSSSFDVFDLWKEYREEGGGQRDEEKQRLYQPYHPRQSKANQKRYVRKTHISEKFQLTSLSCLSEPEDTIQSGGIYELLFVDFVPLENTTIWTPLRPRNDKTYPNREEVAMENFLLCIHEITATDLVENREFDQSIADRFEKVHIYKTEDHEKEFIKPMTSLHQVRKRDLIQKACGIYSNEKSGFYEIASEDTQPPLLRILDIACGRFGEIQTWMQTDVMDRVEIFVGIDFSEREISDTNGGANARLAAQYSRTGQFFDKFVFLQGDCSKPIGSTEATLRKYDPLYEYLWGTEACNRTAAPPLPHPHPPPPVATPTLPITASSDFRKGDAERKGSVSMCNSVDKTFPSFWHHICLQKFHLCSLQFALHYFCNPKNESQDLIQLAKNVSANLMQGGLLIGTCFHGSSLKHSLREKGAIRCTSPTTGKTVLSVEEEIVDGIEGVRVFVESIGQAIWEPFVDFAIVDSIFLQYGLFPLPLNNAKWYGEGGKSDDVIRGEDDDLVFPRILFQDLANEKRNEGDLWRFSDAHCVFVYEKREI